MLPQVAKYYYYPGWWEGTAELNLLVNLRAWEALPPEYKAVREGACYEAQVEIAARYDALNPQALKRSIAGGTQLVSFSNEVMSACYKSAHELYEETSYRFNSFMSSAERSAQRASRKE